MWDDKIFFKQRKNTGVVLLIYGICDIMPSINRTIYALFGNPVSHSMSPLMHNTALEHLGIDGIYVAFAVENAKDAADKIRSYDISGASITIPHKVDIIEHLDRLGDNAEVIGAVNTVINENGALFGVNTDAGGAIKALSEKTEIKGKKIGLFGAGGAARAIVYAMTIKGAKVTVINRTVSKGEKIADDFNVDFSPLSEEKKYDYDIIINTTSIGMKGGKAGPPIKKEYLEKNMTVMDIVYNPLKTELLRDAEEKGCKTVDGLSMFVYQGALQFELFVGKQAPVDVMNRAVRSVI